MRPVHPNAMTLGWVIMPALLAFVLFYSLAFHMHHELGHWPKTIGEAGFSSVLTFHAYLATLYWGIWVILMIFLWPIALLACLWPSRRKYLLYVGIHALSFFVAVGLMQMAPSGYLFWWWD